MISLIVALLLAVYAFFLRAAAGGLTAVDPSRLAPMQESSGFASPHSLERAVAVGQLGSTLAAAIAVAMIGGEAFRLWGWFGFGGIVVLALVLAYPGLELLPLLYAAPRGGRRLMLGILAFMPVSVPLGILRTALRWGIERIIPGPGPNASMVMAVRREALASLSEEARHVKTLRQAQKQLVTQVYEFGESTVEEVMVPRSLIIGLPADLTVGDAVAVAGEHQFSRYPVYKGTLDQVEGVIHIFDLLSAPGLHSPVTPYVRPIAFAPAGKKCDELLGELQKNYQHAAIVVDEFGGTAGWVTVEDLLEELVGEIRDEHDTEEEMVRPVGRRAYLVDASIRVDDLNRSLNLEIPEGDYETLGGFLLEEMERIPRRGESAEYEGVRFEVVQAEPRKIVKVRVELPV